MNKLCLPQSEAFLCLWEGWGEEKKKARGGRWEGIILRALAIFRSLLYFCCYYPAEPLRTREVDKEKFIYYGQGSMKMFGGLRKNRLGQGVKGTATEYAANVVYTLNSAKLIVLREN